MKEFFGYNKEYEVLFSKDPLVKNKWNGLEFNKNGDHRVRIVYKLILTNNEEVAVIQEEWVKYRVGQVYRKKKLKLG